MAFNVMLIGLSRCGRQILPHSDAPSVSTLKTLALGEVKLENQCDV